MLFRSSEQLRENKFGMNPVNEIKDPLHSELIPGTELKQPFDNGHRGTHPHRIHIKNVKGNPVYTSQLGFGDKAQAEKHAKKVVDMIVNGSGGDKLHQYLASVGGK